MTNPTLDKNLFIGKQFNRWTVLDYFPGYRKNGKKFKNTVLCICICGNKNTITWGDLKSGKSKSCGCLHLEIVKRHDLSKTSEYGAWRDMLQRCNNPKNAWYDSYGGRGIKVCERWHKFENFIADMGFKKDRTLSIDRINNDDNYYPENCRWATKLEQILNRSIKSNAKSTLACIKCGKTFFISQQGLSYTKHCSYTCRKMGIITKCLICENDVKSTKSIPRKYCSWECYLIFRRSGNNGIHNDGSNCNHGATKP